MYQTGRVFEHLWIVQASRTWDKGTHANQVLWTWETIMLSMVFI